LFELAGQKYAEAIRIKPNQHDAFNNWGTALWVQAKLKGNTPKGDQLLDEANLKFRQAETLRPGSEAYNLACLAALKSQESECRQWLEVSAQLGCLPSKSRILNDTDLAAYRDTSWFHELLSHCQE